MIIYLMIVSAVTSNMGEIDLVLIYEDPFIQSIVVNLWYKENIELNSKQDWFWLFCFVVFLR